MRIPVRAGALPWSRMRSRYGLAVLLLPLAGMTSCAEDEEVRPPHSTYAIANLLDRQLTVEWNADPITVTTLPPLAFTIVDQIEGSGSTAPGVRATPLWCLRVRLGPGGSTIWYGSDIPYSAYVEEVDPDKDRWFYLALTPEFLEIEQSPTNCMGTQPE